MVFSQCKIKYETETKMEKKKNSNGKIILIAVVIFLIIGVISGVAHNLTGNTPAAENKKETKSSDAETKRKMASVPEEIIWKDEDNMGIANLELDGSSTKQVIISDYYTELSSYINNLDKDLLKDYEYIQFKGNVVNDGKIECTITGNLSIEFLRTSDDLSPANIEDNIQDLFIPKPLR